jgi:NADH dehydrogenase [ubiquinone] 1 alpha subcomplex assembly factor 2
MVYTPPNKDPIMAASEKPWSPQGHVPNRTFSRAAFKTYNTFVVLVL